MQNDFKRLKIWQVSMDLTTMIYKLTATFPSVEKHGLVSQMRRCAVSVPSNIAEGAGRGSDAQFAHFLTISQGSAFELETQLLLAERLNYVGTDGVERITKSLHYIQKMNFKLKESLKKQE